MQNIWGGCQKTNGNLNGFELRSKLFFYQYANYLSVRLLSIKLNYPDCFTTFRFASFHFVLFLCKLNSFMWIYAFKRKKKTWRKRCVYNHGDSYLFRFTYTYANYPSSSVFRWRQKCACLFEHPFYFDYKDFISWASLRESFEKCCNWLSHATR